MCQIYSVLEGGRKSTNNGLAMGVTIGGKSGKNAYLLVIMRVRLSKKIGLLDLTNRTRFKKRKRLETTYEKCARLNAEFV